MSLQLIYFADPMCSWCWGFSPVIEAVGDRFGDRLPIRLVLGGLRPGTTEAMDDATRRTIRHHWEHVRDASGQPFDFAFFDREGFVYDTEPPCRAVVAVRRQDPAAALPFLKRLHRAFYADNTDVTDRAALSALAADHGVARAAFESAFDDAATVAETRADFAIAQQTGIRGFPTLLAGSDAAGYAVVTNGFQPVDSIVAALAALLDQAPQQSQPATPTAAAT